MSPARRLPRCPYARAAFDQSPFDSCAAYAPQDRVFEVVSTGGDGRGQELAVGECCAHLSLQPSTIDFGFVSACTRPGGPPPVATIEIVGQPTVAEPAIVPSPA